MKNKILVTYASSYGSTQEIAQFIADTLHSEETVVALQPMRKVQDLTGYTAVVMGAPIYMFHWHKDALRFLNRHQNTLKNGLPAAVFAGGPFGEGEEKDWQEVRTRFEQELAEYSWFNPVSVEIVGGKFDPAKLRFPYSLIPALRQMPASDLRDWTAIRAWTSSLIPQFQTIQTP